MNDSPLLEKQLMSFLSSIRFSPDLSYFSFSFFGFLFERDEIVGVGEERWCQWPEKVPLSLENDRGREASESIDPRLLSHSSHAIDLIPLFLFFLILIGLLDFLWQIK